MADFEFPDIIIPNAPSAEELEVFRKNQVNRLAFGEYQDSFAIPGAPEQLHYEWHPTDNRTLNYLAQKGFVRNDALAARSTFLNPDKDNGNMIQDVACFTIHRDLKRASDEAFEIAKQLKQDPRLTYADVAALGRPYKNLPDSELAENDRQVISGTEAMAIVEGDRLTEKAKTNT